MNILKTIARILSAAAVLTTVYILLGIAIPFSPELSALPREETWFLFPGLIIKALGISLVLLYICRKSFLPSKALAMRLTLVYIIVSVVLTQVETLYFREAFPVITDGDMIKLFIAGLLEGLIVVPAAVWILSRGRNRGTADTSADFAFDTRWWKYLLAVLLYIVLYLGFGFIAQLFPALKEEYAEWVISPRKTALLPLLQTGRGALFTFSALLIFSMFKRRSDAAAAAALLFAFLISLQLVLPSVIMSKELRLIHFFEITFSMLLYGFFTGKLLLKPAE